MAKRSELRIGQLLVINKGEHAGKTVKFDDDDKGFLVCYSSFLPVTLVEVRPSCVRPATQEERQAWIASESLLKAQKASQSHA